MRFAIVLLFVTAGCAPSTGTVTRSTTVRMVGPDCRVTCAAQLHAGEDVIDCTPPLDPNPTSRDPSMTVCFFGATRASAPASSARAPSSASAPAH